MQRMWAAVALLSLLAAACGRPVTAEPATSPAPSTLSGDCQQIVSEYLLAQPRPLAMRLGQVAGRASIVIGTIIGPLSARYATSTGARPTGNENVEIVTPWQVAAQEALLRKAPSEYLVRGGTVGCDSLMGTPTFALRPGITALIFTGRPNAPAPAGSGEVMEAWEVVNGQVLVPQPPDTVGLSSAQPRPP